MKLTTSRITLALALGGCLSASPAFAQAAVKDGGAMDEIIVTAQKREQRLQDVPVAVTAVNEGTLQVNRVTNVMDLNGLAPGLSARQNAGSLGSPSYTMRGVFASASAASQDREISSYIDGVYVGGTRGAVFDLPDIERVEVLRGPQGTLFGRNATAGAVSVVTRDPSGHLKFRQEVSVGNMSQLRTRTTIDTPKMGIFSAYVTFVHDEYRGDVRNLGAGTVFDRTSPVQNIVGKTTSPEWLGSKNANNVFAAIKMDPGGDFTATYKFDYSHADNTPEARATIVINPNDFVGGMLTRIVAAQPAGGGSFGAVPFFPDYKRPDAVNNAWTMPGFNKSSGHNLTMKWQATDSLSFKNVASYRQTETLGISSIMGLDGLQFTAGSVLPYAQFAAISYLAGQGVNVADPANAALVGGTIGAFAGNFGPLVGRYFAGYEGQSYGKYWQASDEMQGNYQSEKLTLTFGGIWFHSKEVSSGVPNFAANVAFAPTAQTLTPGNVQQTVQRTTSLAAYAQAEYHLTRQFDVIAGMRVTSDKKYNDFTFGGTYNAASNAITGATLTSTTFKKTKPSFNVGVNYKASDDILVYAKFSTAFLSGGTQGPLSFAPETVSSWEAGLKSEWFDRHLRFNAALFQATYKHAQSAQSGANVIVNGQSLSSYGVVVVDNGTIKAKGVELELAASPVTGLSFGASFSYTDVKWLSPSPYTTSNGLHPAAPSGIPAYTGGVNAQYVTPALVGGTTALFRIDGIYQGKYRNSPLTDLGTTSPAFAPYLYTPARWIWNGRVALRDIPVGPLKGEIAIWGRNLANNRDPNYVLIFGTIQADASYQRARTWGADFSVQF
ncbi:MAG: TonB-dependent receptor [Sphingomonadales bacterium]|nr:TonB-dependent receptor [Sphingomonadales bacterium]